MNNIELIYSPHCSIRCQQRGIREEVINFIVKYGQYKNSHQDKKYFINRKIIKKLRYKHESFIKKFDQQILATGVVVHKNIVVTAFKINKNFLWN
jgi:hypothetical protein